MAGHGAAILLACGLSALVSAGVAWFLWRHRDQSPGIGILAVTSLAGALWAGAYFGSLVVTDGTVTTALYLLTQGTSVVWVFGWFAFAARHTGRDLLARSRTVALLAVPSALAVVGIVVSAFDPAILSGLFWTGDRLVLFDTLTVVPEPRGQGYWAFTAYSTLMLVLTVGMLVEFSVRPEQRLYRRRNFALVASLTLPFLFTAFYEVTGAALDPSPIAVGLTETGLALSLIGFGFFDVVPVARRSLVEELDTGVLVYEEGGEIVDVNHLGAELLAVEGDRESVLYRPVTAVVADRFDLDLDDADPDALTGIQVSVGDRDKRHYEIRRSTLTDPEGAEIGRALVLQDVTDQVRRQRELERQKEHLEEFASVLSHDLSTPLDTAAMNVRLVREGDDPDAALDRIESSINRASEITGDLLDLARHGRTVNEPEVVDGRSVVERAWRTLDAADATLEIENMVDLEADRSRLQQLFENLFRNAVEHGSSSSRFHTDDTEPEANGGADVTVRVGVLMDEDRPTGFYVEDDGPGIPETEREKVVATGYTTSDEGTGFGLAVVKQVVDAHGWHLSVSESESGGARFEVVGIATATVPPRPDAEATDSPVETPGYRRSRPTVDSEAVVDHETVVDSDADADPTHQGDG